MATLTVRGQKVVCRSQRRYIVVALREEAIHSPFFGTLVPFARVEGRSDSQITAKRQAARSDRYDRRRRGVAVVIIDTTTGLEV